MIYEINNIMVPIVDNQKKVIYDKLKKIGIDQSDIKNIIYNKRSIDSRKKTNIKYVYSLEVETNKNLNLQNKNGIKEKNKIEIINRIPKKINGKVAVIGTGPAGLFAALRLAEYGFDPLVFERGEAVEDRAKSVSKFWTDSIINNESNIQFGEGGAGTFSDGKLTTRIRSEYIEKVFNEFVDAGSNEEILFDYKPHIGTDVLIKVVKNLRKRIESLGGKIFFNSKITDLNIKNDKVESIEINNVERIDVEYVFLAIGHSARDTYKMLHQNGVYLENKDFAIGARIEHPRTEIDRMQFGNEKNSNILGAAPYNYTYNNTEEKRGVFTFCMCPGGEIINASSGEGLTLTNGMSNSQRSGKFSNAAVVAAVRQSDYGTDLFAGMDLQEKLEKETYNIVGNYGAIYQSVNDFINKTETKKSIDSSYKMDLVSYDMNKIFPEYIKNNLADAFNYWKKSSIFISEKANLIGLETRTSAPIRIKRDHKGISVNVKNLIPIGEGAGYAGGIVSAAVDGIKMVDFNLTEVD